MSAYLDSSSITPPIRVMVVEDENIVALELQHLLARLGHEMVASFTTGEKAVEAVGDVNPDVILMDIRLRGKMDGIATALAINESAAYPIIYITAYSDSETLERAKCTEPYGYILKPINIRELDAILQISLYKNKMENRLKEREQQYYHLFERSNDGIVIFNRDDGRIIDANLKTSVLVGTPKDRLQKKTVYDFIPASHHELMMKRLQPLLLGEGLRVEGRLLTEEEPSLDVEVCISLIDPERGLMQGIVRDVSERNRMQMAVQQHEKLAAQGQLAGRIAHEINNPLGGIKNSFLLIKGAVPGDHPYYPYVNRIENEIDRIARIVRQMVDVYKPVKREITSVDMKEAVKDVVSITALNQPEKRIALEWHPPETPVSLTCARDDLMQVLYNVIQNAIDASPQGGKVSIHLNMKEAVVLLTVSDSGQGIPHEIQSKMYDPFFTTKHGDGRSGLGLGLSVTKSLLESMGGHISYTTGESGSEFTLSWPLNMGQKNE